MLTGILSTIRVSILRPLLLEDYPLEVYTLACNHGWPEVIKSCILPCLSRDILSPESLSDLRGISFPDFARLATLARRRYEGFVTALDDPTLFYPSNGIIECPRCQCDVHDLAWWSLRHVLSDLIRVQPDGCTVKEFINDGNGENAWTNLANATHTHCGRPLYDATDTRANIMEALASLPMDFINT